MTLEQLAEITGADEADLDLVKQELISLGAKKVHIAPSREYVFAELTNDLANGLLSVHGHPSAARKASEELAAKALATSAQPLRVMSTPRFHSLVQSVLEFTPADLKAIDEHADRNGRFNRKLKKMDPAAQQFVVADPNAQKQSYGMPTNLVSKVSTNRQAVWGPGTFGVLTSDLSAFYSYYSVPASTGAVKIPWHKGTPGGDNFGEGTLDATYITSMAPGVATYVINSNTSESTEESPGFGYALENFMLLTMAQAAEVPYVLSMSLGSLSWDSCDKMCKLAVPLGISFSDCLHYVQYTQRQVCMMDSAPQSERINTEFMKLGLRGVTLLAATGDGGSHYSFQPFPSDRIGKALNQVSCTYNFPTFPAASPYVVGVGGTQWSGAPSHDQPIAWGASGSGFSWRFPRPAYQNAAVSSYLSTYSSTSGFPGSQYYNASNRAYPDVSAIADNVPMIMQGFPTVTGGTSASAPVFAGMLSMINDVRLGAGKPSLGFVNPALYQLAEQHPGKLFFDVVTGNSNCASDGSCCSTGFPATKGWDPVTGLGSPLWQGLLNYLT